MNNSRLLVVDDDAGVRASICSAALRMGFDVEAVSDGAEFKRAYERFSPTVVCVDIIMPNVDGIELIKWLVAQNCAARILVISGNPSYAKAARVLGEIGGLTTIVELHKPLLFSQLEAALKG